MQNSSLYSQIHAQSQQQQPPQFPEQEQLKCPRCDSANTKFCYYNNYNLSQPRHFCRSCKRYWTKGGALRNIPVGGGTRKNSKRSTSSSADSAASKRPAVASPSDSDAKPAASEAKDKKDTDRDNAAKVFDTTPLRTEQYENLSFSSLLGSGGDQFAGLLDGLGPTGSDLELNSHFSDPDPDPNPNPDLEIGGNNADGDCDEFLNLQGGSGVGGGGVGGGGGDEGDNGCWGGGGGGGGGGDWTGLSIYTPSSNFQ